MKCHWKLDPSTFGGTFVSTAYSVMDLKIRTLTAHTNAPVQLYPSQTKILEGRTNISEHVFDSLFKGVSTRFWLENVEKCFENVL
jgi:urea transporter